MFIERVNNLIEEIGNNPEGYIASGNPEIIHCYSALFCGGAYVRTCDNSKREYIVKIFKEGLNRAKEMDEIKVRTCKPAFNGLVYVNRTARHYSAEHITDEQAIDLLKNKDIPETYFSKLPEGYEKPLEQFPETPKPKKEAKKNK